MNVIPSSVCIILALLRSATLGVLAASSDLTCVQTCSDYSVVLGHCREQYWVSRECHHHSGSPLTPAAAGNETTADIFVGCLCNGEENDKVLGQEALMRSVGICQSCGSTPPRIQEDLSVSYWSQLCIKRSPRVLVRAIESPLPPSPPVLLTPAAVRSSRSVEGGGI
jgi:hypothetical protein